MLFLGACGPTRLPTTDAAGTHGADSAGAVAPGDNGPPVACGQLTAVLRDFRFDHPDFEHATGDDRGIVAATLGSDGKPVYAHTGGTPTVSGPSSFAQWYRDTDGVNLHFEQMLPLTQTPTGAYVFDDQTFFPLDGLGWPNTEIYGHNFAFTTEIHSSFAYHGGERFEFTGDDDVFVFVNNRLALDLGGPHPAESATIDFDTSASALGLAIGNSYPLAVFHAERHTDQSHFHMETTIDCLIIE